MLEERKIFYKYIKFIIFRPKVLVSLTSDVGSILTSLHDIKLEGSLNFLSGLQVAQVKTKF